MNIINKTYEITYGFVRTVYFSFNFGNVGCFYPCLIQIENDFENTNALKLLKTKTKDNLLIKIWKKNI